MKIARTLVFLLFLVLPASMYAQYELKIEILKLRNSKGAVIVDLLDKDEKTVEARTCLISEKKCTVIFKDLPKAQYALRYIHDENEDKKFSEWLFPVSEDTEIKMTTMYLKK